LYGPGSAKQRFATSYALHRARDMRMFDSSLPGLTRQSIYFEMILAEIDGCAGQARA
jgi:hypothetical protein